LVAYSPSFSLSSISPDFTLSQIDSLMVDQDSILAEDNKKALIVYERALEQNHSDSINIFKKIAIINAELKHPNLAYIFTEKYINYTYDFSILNDGSYRAIKTTSEFKGLQDKYQFKINFLAFLYFYIALIGFYFAIVFNFTKKTDTITKLLISTFVAIHSLFILEFVLYYSNIQYKFPHTFFMTAGAALLFGPLLYLYFKKVTLNYELKKIDLLHFLPTLILIVFLIPIYTLGSSEKMKIMLGISEDYEIYSYVVFFSKLLSLIIYGVFIGKVFHMKHKENNQNSNKLILRWKRNIYRLHIVFVVTYLIYGISISGVFGQFPSFIYHSQVVAMCIMIVYVAYMSYVQPDVFSNNFVSLKDSLFSKYERSGLTESLSNELKENLIKLLVEDKVYKENNLSLEKLSEKLNTTRHNTSQIINEHFEMNFFELINTFRIKEVINILKNNIYGSLHIIDIAYEVGYNNKVTFNKAFKKETSLTPSQFIESLRNNKSLVN